MTSEARKRTDEGEEDDIEEAEGADRGLADELDDGKDSEEADTAVEARARRMGWRPESEWDDSRGGKRPRKFLTAEEYIDKVENDLPVLRERNRFLDTEVASLKGEVEKTHSKLDDLGKALAQFHRRNAVIGKREYERGLAEATEARKAAIEAGDVAAVDKADAAMKSLDELKQVADDAEEEEEPPKKAAEKPDGKDETTAKINPAISAWAAKNPWINDRVLNAYATEEHRRLIAEDPDVPEEDHLDEVKRLTMERFPEKFPDTTNQRRKAPARVATPGNAKGRRSNGKTLSDVPADDVAAFRRNQKWMKENGNVEYTEKEFLESYQWPGE